MESESCNTISIRDAQMISLLLLLAKGEKNVTLQSLMLEYETVGNAFCDFTDLMRIFDGSVRDDEALLERIHRVDPKKLIN